MPMKTDPQTFRLPRLEDTFLVLAGGEVNPHYAQCCDQSRTWIEQYSKLVCGPKMLAFMDKCSFELAAAYFYPYAGPAGLRATMDLINILWLYDEFTDPASGEEAANAAAVVSHALRDPDYNDSTWLCHIMRDFRQNCIDKCGPLVAHRFIDNFCKYVQTAATEAHLREKNEVHDIKGYIVFRRESSAARTVFDFVEYCLGIELPEYVHKDPVFISGYEAAMDLVCWINDICSYNMEQAKDQSGANFVTVIMKSKMINLQSAMDYLDGYCECLTTQLLDAQRALASHKDPAFSRDAVKCLEAYGAWVRGSNAWHFASERYFGKDRKKVKETRIVELRKIFQDVVDLKE